MPVHKNYGIMYRNRESLASFHMLERTPLMVTFSSFVEVYKCMDRGGIMRECM